MQFSVLSPNTAYILYFVDPTPRCNSLLITNLTHFFIYLFITPLYMFQASQCPSSGDRIVLIHHLVWLACVTAWYGRIPVYQAVTYHTNHTG